MSRKGKVALGSHGKQISLPVWAALAALLILYVFSALRTNPIATFGNSSDDALYFASAKALSNGQGYVLPSFPVRLRATKYPELYPLLLAGVWKLDPHFPNNIRVAVGITLAFGCAALIFIFLLLRRWPGVSDWEALVIAALCGFSSYFLYLSACVRTEIPFTAMLLAAIWFAEHRKWGGRAAFAAGFLAGFSVGFRSLGVAVIAGIALFLLLKRDLRRFIWFSLAAVPLALLCLWPALQALFHSGGPHLASGLSGSGWTQTLCYYTSYACAWHMGVSSPAAFFAVALANLKSTIQAPGSYLVFPLAGHNSLWSLVLVTLISAASYVGIVRYTRKAGWQPLVTTFLFYLLIIIPWPWTPGRFLLTFLPLFVGGFWFECRDLSSLVTKHLGSSYPRSERMTAGVLGAAILVLASVLSVNYTHAIPSQLGGLASKHSRALKDQRGAYEWIRRHTDPDAKIIAYEDGLLFLYTGRSSILPIMAHTQDFYLSDRKYSEYDAAHMDDVARHIGASYWLVTASDFDLTDNVDYAFLQKREQEWLARAPVVYRDEDGAVRLYDVRCLTGVKKQGCATGSVGRNGTPHSENQLAHHTAQAVPLKSRSGS